MGLLWVGTGVFFDLDWRTSTTIVLVSLLLILSLIDLDTKRLPNVLVGLLAVAGAVSAVASQFSGKMLLPAPSHPASGLLSQPFVIATLGVLLGAGLSLCIAQVYAMVRNAEGFGMGDVKLLGAIGLFVGPYVAMVFLLACFTGTVWMLVSRQAKSPRMQVPFGPFIAFATGIVLVFGELLWMWYAGLVGFR